jgi:asparagine synthetase B (glutamine-hydrolysing)
MAGICGIFQIKPSAEKQVVFSALNNMMDKLAADITQLKESSSIDNWHIGSVMPVSAETHENFFHTPALSMHCIVDGQVFVSDTEKHLVGQKFPHAILKNDNDYIPWLYSFYKVDFVKHLTGWFNIFIYDKANETALLCNDRLGLLPLYFYESDQVVVFASKIECILASGLMNQIEFDTVTLAEHLLFNYPISDHTFIRNISTIPSATQTRIAGSIIRTTYWSPGDLICDAPLSKTKSLDLIDEALSEALRKPFEKARKPVCATLTGGFDGRLVLSCLLDQYRDRLRVFSFGAASSPDITIPQKIASKEGFSYEPIILDREYMEKSFIDNASATIILSGGIRSYRRSHYLYAMQKISGRSEIVISGNFGDEIIKFAQVLPSEVISKALISLVQSGFSNIPDLVKTAESLLQLENSRFSSFSEELNSRLELIASEVGSYDNLSHKFHHLKFTRIASKFFGNELSSYNDYVQSFSPFLDTDFLKAFHMTSYAGIYYPFSGNKLEHKEMASSLYAELIRRNKKSLLSYQTDRGYKISALTNPLGQLEVLLKKFLIKKSKAGDPYYLENSETTFRSFMENYRFVNKTKNSQYILVPVEENMGNSLKDRLYSLNYWICHIENNYPVNSY